MAEPVSTPTTLHVAFDVLAPTRHTTHMKRTNLVLDEKLLAEAVQLSGERTYSATVGRALEDFVRRAKARQILELRGSGIWQGELGEMRGDLRGATLDAQKDRS